MNHPSLLELSMYADKALDDPSSQALAAHLEQCDVCQQQVAALRAQSQYLLKALQLDEPEELVIPKFSRPISLRNFALANVATGLVIWLAQFLWKTLFGELLVNATSWATSIYLPDVYQMASSATLYLLEEGTAMLDAYLGFVVVSVCVLTFMAILFKWRRTQSVAGLGLVLFVWGAVAIPTPAYALQVMQAEDDVVDIPATQTIDDTLIVAADTVLIKGTVLGDVIAVGRVIDVSGEVRGNLVTFADDIKIRGSVGGFVLGASSSINLEGAEVGGDVWLAGEKVNIGANSRVGRNATAAAQTISLEGAVGKDLYAFSESVEVNGELGANLEAFAARVSLLDNAKVDGNVRLRMSDRERLYQADSSQVAGEIEFLGEPERQKSRFARVEFYLWEVAKLIAAFLVGWVLLTLLPSLRKLYVGAGVDGLKTAGVGLLALVSVPIMCLLTALTLVGLPFALIVLFAWMLALYLTQILVAAIVGRMLLSDSDSLPLTLLVGLLIVVVATNLPLLGGVVSFVITVVGLGLLVQFLFKLLSDSGDSGSQMQTP